MYDQIFGPAKDGPAIPNTIPERNLVRTDPEHLPPRPAVGARGRPAGHLSQFLPVPGNGDAGWFVNDFFPGWGPGALEIVQPDLNIPSSLVNLAPPDTGVVIYAPTNKPRGSCLELTPLYRRLPGWSTTARQLGWFDWCASPPQWQTMENIDLFWQSEYTVAGYWIPGGQNEVQMFWGIRLVPGTNCWEGLLYNNGLNDYERKALSCGTPAEQRGWSMWESYYLMTYLTDWTQCPTIPEVGAYIPVDGDAIWLDNANRSPIGPFGVCWRSGYYYLDWYIEPNGGYHAWQAHTP